MIVALATLVFALAVFWWFGSRRRQFGSPAEVVDAIVRAGEAPGAQYVHVDRDRVVISHVSGLADVAAGAAVTPETVFAGYSTTKTLTAAAVMRLAVRGAIDLEAPLSRYLSELGEAGAPTVRQTLQHTGGWANPIPVGWVHLATDHAAFDSEAFFRRTMSATGRPAPPGRKFAYSNVGYLALGAMVQRVSGQPYESFVTADVIDPLMLEHGAYLGFLGTAPEQRATGFVRRSSFLDWAIGWFLDRRTFLLPATGRWVAFRPLTVDGAPYGGIFANARGFGRYLQAMLRREPPFDSGIADALAKPGTLADGRPSGNAHGWFLGELNGEPYLHHAGGGGGFYCEIRVYPRLGRASAVMFNRSGMSDDRILDQIDAAVIPGAGSAAAR